MKLGSARWLRVAGTLWMLAFLIWLPFEDTAIWMALALATGACLWLWLRLLARTDRQWQIFAGSPLLGTVAPLLAIALMALKSGLHGHGFADFTARQIWEVIYLLPLGMLAGLILGIGAIFVLNRSH